MLNELEIKNIINKAINNIQENNKKKQNDKEFAIKMIASCVQALVLMNSYNAYQMNSDKNDSRKDNSELDNLFQEFGKLVLQLKLPKLHPFNVLLKKLVDINQRLQAIQLFKQTMDDKFNHLTQQIDYIENQSHDRVLSTDQTNSIAGIRNTIERQQQTFNSKYTLCHQQLQTEKNECLKKIEEYQPCDFDLNFQPNQYNEYNEYNEYDEYNEYEEYSVRNTSNGFVHIDQNYINQVQQQIINLALILKIDLGGGFIDRMTVKVVSIQSETNNRVYPNQYSQFHNNNGKQLDLDNNVAYDNNIDKIPLYGQ